MTTLFQGEWRDVYLMRWGRRHPVGYVRRVDMAGICWWEAADRDRLLLKSEYGAVRRWMARTEAEEAVRLHRPRRATDG